MLILSVESTCDETAVAVVERYIHYLSVGIANVINCFFPEVVALSGGIAVYSREELYARLEDFGS